MSPSFGAIVAERDQRLKEEAVSYPSVTLTLHFIHEFTA